MKPTIRRQLVGLVLLSFVGTAAFGLFAYRTLESVRVRGAEVRRIAAAGDPIRVAAEEQAMSEMARERASWMLALCLAIAGVTLTAGLLVSRRIVSALHEVRRAAQRMAGGDLTARAQVTRQDEIGELADATDLIADSLSGVLSHLQRRTTMLANASGEMSSVSDQMSATAEETSSQASMVSASAEQVTRNMHTVAVAVEEMTASIQEIAKNTGEAARMASSAAGEAQGAGATVRALGASSAEIGNVVQVIHAIAEQTNLLALNATIEAARAGEAGKGFAVVANEVKELAKETALATRDIAKKIETIQADTGAAIAAITQISARVQQIRDISTAIASAIDQQLATTAEIGRNLNEAASGSTEISSGVLSVAQAAKETAVGSVSTQSAAGELARMAAELRQLTGRFKLAVEPPAGNELGGGAGFASLALEVARGRRRAEAAGPREPGPSPRRSGSDAPASARRARAVPGIATTTAADAGEDEGEDRMAV